VTGNPYPGFRPFERDDAHLFFGREKPVKELVALLARHRFLAVVGVSGSGKSSLVKAGLLPTLHLGAMGEEFPDWRVAVMTPAGDPLGELCKALSGDQALGPDPDCRALLESTGRGLIERTLRAGLEDGAHLLVVVDQFEEIFKYREDRAEGPEQSARFVRLLLDATEEKEKWARIYVLLTMRSDFLGQCAGFQGLPEALNKCQYLVPRMTRDERREAIERPARVAGAEIEASLVDRLLNDAGDDAGQLPVLQHALNRTFAEFEKAGRKGEIKLDCYEAAGKLEDALNRHADALLDAPEDPDGGWTGKVFRCLTTVQDGHRVRRRTPLSLLYAVVGARDDKKKELVWEVIKRYSDPVNSMISLKGPDQAGDLVADISHEGLILKWKNLGRWVDAETEAVRVYMAAVDDVLHYGAAGTRWGVVKLDEALAYNDPERGVWNGAWAGRLKASASYQQVCGFLNSQKDEQAKEEEDRKAQEAKDLAVAQQAVKDAEAVAAAQAEARQAAETAAGADRKAREEAEAREQVERKATEAAVSLAKAQRQKKRLVGAVLGTGVLVLALAMGVLGLYLLNIKSRNKQLALQKKNDDLQIRLSQATDLVPALRRQIDVSDEILKQIPVRERDLRSQIAHESDPAEKRKLEQKLGDVLKLQSQTQGTRAVAETRLAAESKHLSRVNPADGLTYVFIPPGAFTMGCSPGDGECNDNEKPPHAEQIANGFWLGQTEVTQAAWKKVMNNIPNPSHFKGDQLPVENVDWNDASAYCKAIGGRLPTEKEWEYAARAGTAGKRYGPPEAVAWYDDNSGGTTHPVGLKQANAFGLYDMLGNVWEWTADNYDPAGQYKVVRGGSWYSSAWNVRASVRVRLGPSGRSNIIGFRCVGEFR
jgi:formylglycine-generating enzyme required for sulfatase activity